jgi:hypothetical protein
MPVDRVAQRSIPCSSFCSLGSVGLGELGDDLEQLAGEPRLRADRRCFHAHGQSHCDRPEHPLGTVQAQTAQEVDDGHTRFSFFSHGENDWR